MCGPHQVWPLRSECCGRGVPTKVVCAECMKMCCLGGKNSVVKGLRGNPLSSVVLIKWHSFAYESVSGVFCTSGR